VLQGALSITTHSGTALQSDLTVIGTPGCGMIMLATSDFIIEDEEIESRQVEFEIYFRECIIGERLTEAGVCEYCKGP